MEEAWEYAVVKKTSPTAPPDKLKYNDLDDRTYSAATKFEAAAIVSIAVNYLNLSCDSSLLGLQFVGFNERVLEWSFSLGALLLAINYWMRLHDEGRVVANLNGRLEEIASSAMQAISEFKQGLNIQSAITKFEEDLRTLRIVMKDIAQAEAPDQIELKSSLKRSIEQIKLHEKIMDELMEADRRGDSKAGAGEPHARRDERRREIIREAQSELNGFAGDAQQLATSSIAYRDWVDGRKNFDPILDSLARIKPLAQSSISEITDALDAIEVRLADSEIRPRIAKARLVMFSWIIPALLMALVMLSLCWSILIQSHRSCPIEGNQEVLSIAFFNLGGFAWK